MTSRRHFLAGGAAITGLGLGTLATDSASGDPAAAAVRDTLVTPDRTVLYRAGDGGYASYRIPALVATPNGRLWAFAEARTSTTNPDSGDIDITARFTDDYVTWSPRTIVVSIAADTIGNPTVVFDPGSGHLVLVLTHNTGSATGPGIHTGADPYRRVYVLRCPDPEAQRPTWTAATDITAEVRGPGWRWYATGPGTGAVLRTGPHAGRIVIPCAHTRPPTGRDTGAEGKYASAHLIYSDGQGMPGTWRIGAMSAKADGQVNEGEQAITVLADGRTLYCSVRCEPDVAPGNRADALSRDGGRSYEKAMRPQGSIVTAVCQGSLLTLPDGRVVYAGPSHSTNRAAMALWVSANDGRSFRPAYPISGLPAAYSSLARTRDGKIAVLYETGDQKPYEWIEIEYLDLAVLG